MSEQTYAWNGWWRLTSRHRWRVLVSGPDREAVWHLLRDEVARKGGGDSTVLPQGEHPNGKERRR